jgi:hypothetical protein
MKGQINLQSSLNPENRSHMKLWDWINEETTNRSSFIRETLYLRMMGKFKSTEEKEVRSQSEFDADEVLRLIQV